MYRNIVQKNKALTKVILGPQQWVQMI